MTSVLNERNESAIGLDVVNTGYGSSIFFRHYLVDRPAHTKSLRAVEGVTDISIVLGHTIRKVWPVFKDFNLWMNRFGYAWEGVPADNENNYVYLGNTGAANDLKYGSDGTKTQYVVRKVIAEKLIYWDSLPLALVGKDGVWSGHNLASLQEDNGRTAISFFMEHTWYSQTMTLEELRAEARWATFEAGHGFWRDYFIPDLLSLIETGKVAAAV